MTSFCAFALLAVFAGTIVSAEAQEPSRSQLVHTREEFSFVVNASYDETFPLFGAYEERKWAAGFHPQFVFPFSPHDQQGMVFTTEQHGATRVWVNTVFDRNAGKAQYVYFVPEKMVALIDVQAMKISSSQTKINVVYERTALASDANQHVIEMARSDANAGPEWAAMINGYFASARASTH